MATALSGPRVLIENRTFDEIQLGETAVLERTLTRKDIELFAVMSGDVNPAHLDDEYAQSDMFHKIVAHIYARRTLEAGFTTIRDVGAGEYIDIALKRAIDKGDVPGPRMIAAGVPVSSTGGHGDQHDPPGAPAGDYEE